MARLLIALTLALLLPAAASAATPVMRAHPVSYELARLGNDGGETIAAGEALLREGRTEVLEPEAAGQASQLRIALTASPSQDADPGLIIDAEVSMRIAEGTRRARIGDSGESFIEAPRTREVRFANRSWRRSPDPAPIQVTHEDQDQRYRLTLRFRD